MSVAETILAVLGSVVTVLAPAGGLAWWIYQRGRDAGYKAAKRDTAQAEDKARIENLERQLTETQKQLAAIQQPKSVSGHA